MTEHLVLTDSTHVKDSTSSKANVKMMVERETTDYMERLDRYEAVERERLEASRAIKPQRAGQVKKARQTEKTINCTDPDAGMLRRRGKPEGEDFNICRVYRADRIDCRGRPIKKQMCERQPSEPQLFLYRVDLDNILP